MSRSWSISFDDEENNQIKGIKSGYGNIDMLRQIVETIECYTNDSDITKWLHNISEA